METTTFELQGAFREGVLQGVLWDDKTIQRAASCLTRIPHLPELALLDNNRFLDGASFRALLQLLARRTDLQRLYISQSDLSSYLADLAAVFGKIHLRDNQEGGLKELELVTGSKIRDADAPYLRQLVQSPSQSLSFSFNLKQRDFGPCLEALRQGLDDLKKAEKAPVPRVVFRNVSFPDHEYHLHRFLAMVCEAQCVDSLQLNPRRRRVADVSESCRVGPGFLQALARLLAFGRVRSLEVTNVRVDAASQMDERVVAELCHALARNTSLERFSMSSTKGLATVWQQAIFPALAVNRTLKRLEFGHEPGVVHAFLHHLPNMRGLESIQAPWRSQDGPAWMDAVRQTESLCHVHFRLVPDVKESLQQLFVEDYCLTQTRQLAERNRLTRQAHVIVRQEPPAGPLVDRLAGFKAEAGLDARYVLLRESLALFA